MARCVVVDDLSQEQFVTLLKSQGDLIDFSKRDREVINNAVYLGRVLKVGQAVHKQEQKHALHDSLFVKTSSFHSNEEIKEFRIIFLGSIVASLLEADLQENFLIGLLNPTFYNAFGQPSLTVGPQNPAVWILKNTIPRNLYSMRKRLEKDRGKPESFTNSRISALGTDDTDADPPYVPESISTKESRSKNKIRGRGNTLEDSDSAMTNSSSTFSFSVHRDHEVYRSAPVNLKEIVPLSKERSIGRSSPFISSVQQLRQKNECYPKTDNGQNECFPTPQECSNNLRSQNTAEAGSVINSTKSLSVHRFVVPENTKSSKTNNFVNRTQVSQRSGCSLIKKCNSSCLTRHCHVNFPSNCHCASHHCSTYRQDCCRPSCHMPPCGSHYNHCCPPQTHSCAHQRRPERDCGSYVETGCQCRNRVDRVCLPPHGNQMPHCSTSCRPIEKCCRHFEQCSPVCTGRQHCSSDCCNCSARIHSHSHHSRHDESALKSLEQLIERRSEHMNNRGDLGVVETDYPIETAKRTESWVQDWTPSLPAKGNSPPPPLPRKLEKFHSTPKHSSHRNKNIRPPDSDTTILSSDSDSEEDISRKRMRTSKKDLVLSKSLATVSSQSTTYSRRQDQRGDFTRMLANLKNKGENRKKKLYNAQDSMNIVTPKSKIHSLVEESTPFNSEQTDVDKNNVSENLQTPSVTQEMSIALESSEKNVITQKNNAIESTLLQDRVSKIASDTKESSSNLQNTTDKNTIIIGITDNINGKSKDASIETTLISSKDNNDRVTVSEQCLVSQENSGSSGNAIQNQKSSEEIFPELRLDSLSDEKLDSNNTQPTHSAPVDSIRNNVENKELGNNRTIVNGDAFNDQAGEILGINRSLSLSDYPKIKLCNMKKEDVKPGGIESNCSSSEKKDCKSRQGLSDDQVELVCESKLKKRKRRKKKNASDRVSSRSSASTKSNETIDLENIAISIPSENAGSTISTPCTFYDAQSSSSQQSKTTSAEKWTLKPLHELLNLDQNVSEAFMKMLPCSSKKRSYNLALFGEFQVTGVIIGTVPDVIASPFSIVRAYCNDGCKKSYSHEEYESMEEYEYSCTFCRYRSHWVCPGCKEKGLRNPLCVNYSLEVHLFDGENVLRIEVENQEAVTLLGCTPTVYMKDCSRLVTKLKKTIVTSLPSNLGSVPFLKATVKTTSKNGSVVFTLQRTSLKKNLLTL